VTDVVGFVALAIVVIVRPGPDTALDDRRGHGVVLVAFGVRVAVAPR